MRLSKGDIAFTAVTITIAVALAVWLYIDLNRSADAGNRKPIGKIIFKERVAQRRLSREAVWDNLRTEMLVYNGDTIRTENMAQAEIVLNDDSRIALEENTLIVLNFAGDEARLDFSYGGIRTESSGKSDLKVKSGDTEVSLAGANARLSSDSPNALQVEVRKGNASVNRSGRKENVAENQSASVDGDKIETAETPVILQSPADGERLVTDGAARDVRFQWQSAKPAVFEISRARDFHTILQRQKATGAAVASLTPGPYFWRVVSEGSGASAPRSLSLLKQDRVQLHSPANGTSLSVKGEQAAIQFSWSAIDVASSYELQIFKGPDGREPLHQTPARTTLMSVPLSPGVYSWKVIPKSSMQDAALPSSVQTFTVRHLDKMPAPVPISPASATVLKGTIEQQGLPFLWKAAMDGGTYRLQIANNTSFNAPLLDEPSGGNSRIVKQALPEGKLFWRLVTEDGATSAALDFNVQAHTEVTSIFPVGNRQLQVPATENIILRWQGTQGIPSKYRVLVSASPDLANPVVNEIVQSEAISVKLQTGAYAWKVTQLDTAGNALGESRTEQFHLTLKLPAPVPLFPAAQATVDMSQLDGILFRWNAVNGAAGYRFRLFHRGVQIFEGRTQTPQLAFQRLDLLDTDVFAWTVAAYSPAGDGDEVTVPFRIALETGKEKPTFVSPDTIFVK